jgi:hypothetical protein
MTKDLHARIVEDIAKTGFPLELRVAALLRGQGHPVATNIFFIDRDEGKGREVDLRVLINLFAKRGRTEYAVRHCVLVECKKSASRPWVVFTSPSVSYDQRITHLHCRGLTDDVWAVPRSFKEHEQWERRHPWFTSASRGRSFYQAFAGGVEANQAITKALTSVVKALIEVRDSQFGARGSRLGFRNAAFYYPLVVLEGALYAARLSHGKLIVHAVPCVAVSVNYRSSKYPEDEQFTVMIVRERFLAGLLRRLRLWQEFCAGYLIRRPSRFKVDRRARRRRTTR